MSESEPSPADTRHPDLEAATADDEAVRPLSRSSTGYKQIAATLVLEIQRGIWNVGDQLPPEIELAKRWGVTRVTLRAALQQLANEGYIGRQKGARTTILSVKPQGVFINSVESFEEHTRYYKETLVSTLSIEVVALDRVLAKEVGATPGESWTRVSLIRHVPSVSSPFCYSEVFIRPAFQDVVKDLPHYPIYDAIEKRFGIVIHSFIQQVQSQAADANIASRLSIKVGAPVLRVAARLLQADQTTVQCGFTFFPAEKYKFEIQFRRAQT